MNPPSSTRMPPWVWASAMLPIALLAVLVYWFFHGGSRLIERPVLPIEKVSVRRVEFSPSEIKLTIRNTGPTPVDMTIVTVDEAIWKAEFSPGRHLERFQEATVQIPFDWVDRDPYKITLFPPTEPRSLKKYPSPRIRPKQTLDCFGLSLAWAPTLEYFPFGTAFFLPVGAGAISQVVWTIGRDMMETLEGSLFTVPNALGFLVGMLVMYGTALLVTA